MYKRITLLCVILTLLIADKATCSAGELLQRINFRDCIGSVPWLLSESAKENAYTKVVNGEFMVHIDKTGTKRDDIKLSHGSISIVEGHTYTVHFKLRAAKACKIYAKIADQYYTNSEVWNNNLTEFTVPYGQTLDITKTFTANQSDRLAEYAFYLGGDLNSTLPNEIYFSEMSLQDSQFVPIPTSTPLKRDICVNQLGYYPNAVKKATLLSNSTLPIDVQLIDSSGNVVWTGKSQPKAGTDAASGDSVHIIDFSDCKSLGKNYQLIAGSKTSFPFDIGNDMYSKMKYDALKYFYFARSETNIKPPYCINSMWARPEGHNPDISHPAAGRWYTGGPVDLDVTGGWYDASDYDKSAVNGGTAVWTLQNLYEHALLLGRGNDYADGNLGIPESGNGVPDILDESRWEIEMLLKMQIPAGFEKAGMVCHNVADEHETSYTVRPDTDIDDRIYYPPSTAATLNLAAAAAQASRLWKEYDPAFSERCLKTAETAWSAAVANPDIYASFEDLGIYESGKYGDNIVQDDFYWAACELYITTGKTDYYNFIRTSSYYLKIPELLNTESADIPGCFNWSNTSALGTISLALSAPEGISSTEISTVKANICAAADKFTGIQKNEGYGVPIQESTNKVNYNGESKTIWDGYPWGSNLNIVNESILMAYAYDFSGNTKYFNGAIEALDYIMGRNPLTRCYITGYGSNPVINPHHLFFANQADTTSPEVPPGFLVSGPNSLQNPYNLDVLAGVIKSIPAQKSYTDTIENKFSNDVNIGFNASLAWITAYLENTQCTYQPPRWDINSDGAVNMSDVMLIAGCFNSKKGDGRYDPVCDLDDDGVVNMSDVMVVANYFGKTYN